MEPDDDVVRLIINPYPGSFEKVNISPACKEERVRSSVSPVPAMFETLHRNGKLPRSHRKTASSPGQTGSTTDVNWASKVQ